MRDELADVGMPFALFKGTLKTVSDLLEDGECTICGQSRRYLFRLRDRDYLIDPCEKCGEHVGLRIGWPDEKPEPSTCRICGTIIFWPNQRPRDVVAVCYQCLRAGRVAVAHETEVGNIDLAHALHGLTYFAPPEIASRHGLETAVLETYADGSQSIGVRLSKDLLSEMLRTPRHMALQREYWPFHCHGFMAYLGRWQLEDFEKQSPGRGREWFGEHMGPDEPWEDMWEWLPADIGWSYVFQCQTCGRHRVFVDSD
jgi:uncharacterized protein CbrC (UPF0167 family)